MIRLLVSIIWLGLVLAPLTTNAAASPQSGMPGCTMDGKMPSKPANHGKMDCCTPACQAPSSVALSPNQEAAVPIEPIGSAKLAWPPAKELTSFAASDLDPPPRA